MKTEYIVTHNDAIVSTEGGIEAAAVLARGSATDCVGAAKLRGTTTVRRQGNSERAIDFETLLEIARLESMAREYETTYDDVALPNISM